MSQPVRCSQSATTAALLLLMSLLSLLSLSSCVLSPTALHRRAEAEADLIGLKLMAIAGYNPDQAPKTFAKMEEYQAHMMGKAAANASYIQDHPRSASRVKLLKVGGWSRELGRGGVSYCQPTPAAARMRGTREQMRRQPACCRCFWCFLLAVACQQAV